MSDANLAIARHRTREGCFETMAGKEFFEFICGEMLGWGTHRSVFLYRPDPTLVLKFQNEAGPQNWREWDLWRDTFEHPNQQWLAPCVSISDNGVWLLQKRTFPIPKNTKWPNTIPEFMTDIKKDNFGLYKGRIVQHDYANNLTGNYARTQKMKKYDFHNG